MRTVLFLFVFVSSFVMVFANYSTAQDDPKEIVEEIFEIMESIEVHAENDQWANVEVEINKLEKMTKDLSYRVKPTDKSYAGKITLLAKGMLESAQSKDDDELEVPYYSFQKLVLDLMETIDYGYPAVFVFLEDHIKEALQANEAEDFDRVSEEIEEFINMRADIQRAGVNAGLPKDQITSLLMLSMDVEMACERKDKELVQKDLKRMKMMIDSFKKAN